MAQENPGSIEDFFNNRENVGASFHDYEIALDGYRHYLAETKGLSLEELHYQYTPSLGSLGAGGVVEKGFND